MSAPASTLAEMVRAKNPGAYDDMDDVTLENKVLAKYPQYADLPRTSTGTPITDNTSMSAPTPEIVQQGQELKNIAGAAVNSKFPYIHPFDAISAAGTAASQEIQRNAPSQVTKLLLGGQAAGEPMGTSGGVLNNPVTQAMSGAIPVGAAADAVEDAPAISNGIAGAYDTAKNAIGNFTRDPLTGKLKPIAKVAAKGLGAAAGYEATKGSGHGLEGTIVGGLVGPQVADALLPSSGAFQEAQTASQLQQGMDDAWTARQKELADTERMRNLEAQSLMNRGKQQDILDRQATDTGSAYGPPGSSGPTGSAAPPFEPTIYSSPEEEAQMKFRMANLKRQAQSAGMYHAAQGRVGAAQNLQQRIQGAIDPYSPTR